MSTMPIVSRGRFFQGSEQPTPSNQELKCAAALPIQSCWGGPAVEPVSISKRASSPSGWSEESEGPASTRAESESSVPKVSMQISLAESSDDDQKVGSSISIARTASHLSGSKIWESDDDKWSSEEELDAESCDSFCSALDAAADDLDDLMPAPAQQVQDNVFSISLLLQVRGAMLSRKDVPSTQKFQGLRCEPCPTEKVSPKSSPSGESPKSSLTSSSSPTAWKPSRAQGAGLAQDRNQQVARAARSILNKLTVEKFDALYEQLADCGLKTPEHVKILMREIFEKATAEHHFIPMYADLCVRLEPDARVSAALGNPEQHAQSFKRLLLNQCQASFEELLVPDPAPVVPKTEEEAVEAEEARMRTKQRKLGNVKLVGELLLRRILQPQLLCTCIEDLLECWKDCSEAIESLAALLTVAGPKFDLDKEWSHRHRLVGLFDQISKLVESRSLAPRQRFLLKDVLDLRASGWHRCGQSGPKRLVEVRKEASPAEKVSKPAGATAGLAAAFSFSPKDTEAGSRTPLQLKPADSNRTPQSKSQPQRPVPPPFFPSANDPKVAATASPVSSFPSRVKKEDRISALNRLSAICQAGSASCTAGRSSLFDVASFHKVLSAVLRQLRADKNTFAAVRAVRAELVPKQFQAREFADLITRISEDSQGPARRVAWSFIMALCSSEESAFEKEECIKGARTFFQEVYPELRAEVPRLSRILGQELLPMLRKSWGATEVDAIVPQDVLTVAAS
eukprot:TRINITY_DN7112_c0_g1_i1.p1 TRINITY_DN7112_c0_g1~~TRINITY_DN7112_c0_g1_i1.p1  ORF type:complete len:740 (+),score=161.77 TRINITY_DN7112_c0_g1_i1:213-2432(+)